jgi:hypothetical protein
MIIPDVGFYQFKGAPQTLAASVATAVASTVGAGVTGFPTPPTNRVYDIAAEDREVTFEAETREVVYTAEGVGSMGETILHEFPLKDPNGRLDYLFNFTNLLETAELITTATVTMQPTTGMTLETSSIVAAGKKVLAIFSSGVRGTTYVVTVKAETDSGGPPTRIFERSAQLSIRDI